MDLNQITVPSIDVPRAVVFYQKLGLKLIVDSAPRYVRFECPEGSSTFSIHRVESPLTDHGLMIYFECENLDETVENLVAHGIHFDQLPVDQRWLWREARLRDPDGNLLVLYHAGENRKNPPWRIST